MFGGANKGPSLFSAPAKTEEKPKEDDDDDEESESEKSPPIYASDTAKVEFKGAAAQAYQPSPYTKLFEKHVNKFKIVKPEQHARKITACDVSIEFAETDGKKVYLVVVRQAKKVLIQGSMHQKVSRSRRVEEVPGKHHLKIAMQLTVEVQVPKEDGSNQHVKQKKIIFPYCVIDFKHQEEMINFETEFTKAAAELKKAGGQAA